MLERLFVKNLALIEEQEVLFTGGLNILSGETGAGKSVILGSIALAMGGRADKELIRRGEDCALIELSFRVENDAQRAVLQSMGLQPDEDGTILIKRKIYPTKTVNTACGESVTLSQLKTIGEILLNVYGQHESMRLLRKEEQRNVVDEYAGEEGRALLDEVKASYAELRELEKALRETEVDETTRQREADLLRYEIQELTEADLVAGEDEKLEASYQTLHNAERIVEALQGAESALREDGISGSLSAATREIAKVARYGHELEEIEKQLTDIDALVSEAGKAIADCLRDMTADPEELLRVTKRLDEINRLKDKYRGDSLTPAGADIEDLLRALSSREERLAFLENLEKAKEVRAKEYDEKKRAFLTLCDKLTEMRTKSGEALSLEMEKALKDLRFSHVAFRTEITSDPEKAGDKGQDDVRILISLNEGEEVRPLDKIASGGELSRIMLALKTVFAGKEEAQTFIFDEIDSGISGQTAWRVAEKLGELAKRHQILCITHLPQIAAMQDTHFLIEKEERAGKTTTRIHALQEEESTKELARLLGGDVITEAALSNAKEMRKDALRVKQA